MIRKLCVVFLIELITLPLFGQSSITATGAMSANGTVSFTSSTTGVCTITSPSTLPNAIQFSGYSQTLTSTNCTAPNWIVTSGPSSLPPGITLSTAGVLSGSCTTTGGYAFNVEISNASNLPTKLLSLTCVASGADNRYCGTGNVPNFGGGGVDTVATLPIQCINTARANTPSPGPVKTVCPSGCDFSTMSAAAAAAVGGWTIKVQSTSNGLPSGTQLNYGAFTITATGDAAHWITVETDQLAGLPPEGTRVSPAFTGIPSLHLACILPETSPEVTECGRPAYSQPMTAGIYMPKIIASGTLLNCGAGTAYWRFIGIEWGTNTGAGFADMVNCSGSNNIIFDQIVSHGGNSPTWQSTDQITRNFDFQGSTYFAVIDSYLGETHLGGAGSSNALLGGIGAVGEGPCKFVNNFMESADSTFGAGGGGVGTSTQPVHDCEIRRNHIWKPMFWKSNDTTYFGTLFDIKDHIDLKNFNRFLIEGNILDHSWGQQSDQPGPSMEFGAKNQSVFFAGTGQTSGTSAVTAVSGTFPTTMTSSTCAVANECLLILNGVNYRTLTQTDSTHITVTPTPPCVNNASIVAAVNVTAPGSGYVSAGVSFSGGGGSGAAATATVGGGIVTGITVVNSGCGYTSTPTVAISGSGTGATAAATTSASSAGAYKAYAPGLNPVAQATNATIRYNIIHHVNHGLEFFSAPSDAGDIGGLTGEMSVHDNVADDINGAWNLNSGACCDYAVSLYLSNGFASPNNMDALNIQHNTLLSRITNFASLGNGPGLGTGAQTVAGAAIGHLTIINNISAAGFRAAAKGVCTYSGTPSAETLFTCWTPAAQLCMDHNGMATTTVTSGSVTTTVNNPLYPTPGDNLGCGFTPTGNTLIGTYDLIQFTNLNGASGGNYQLQLTSPFHNAASDGTDLGANISLTNSYTNGVQ